MDLIDRQALLKQIDIDLDDEPGYYGDTWKFIDTIKKMPSAVNVPDTNVGELISRQAAIDTILGQPPELHYPSWYAEQIRELPSVQLGTNLAEVGMDLISRQAVMLRVREFITNPSYTEELLVGELNGLPPEQSEIIYCKDCAKHNKGLGNYEVHPDGSSTWIWKDSACPLVSWRGKAQGHEYDYQYCVYAERKVTE